MKYLFFFSCLFFGASRAFAQKPTPTPEPVQMSVSSPFAAIAQPLSVVAKFGRWFPISVTISNTGDALAGEVSLRLTARANDSGPPSIPTVMSVAAIDLPQNAKKRIWLYGRVDGVQWDGAVVRFQARGARTLEAPIDLRSTDLGKRLVLTVSDAGEPLKYLEGFTNPALESIAGNANSPRAANSQKPLTSLAVKREGVPDRWVGLEAADAVVLHDFAHTALSPSQLAALRGYVASGGTLIVAGGANWQRLASSPLADLWPVAPQSSAAATPAETREIVARYLDAPRDAGDRLGGSPAVIARGTLKAGARRLAGTEGTALEAVWPRGAGRVVWLAFEPSQPPFAGWRGQENLWIGLSHRMQSAPRFEGVDPQRREAFGDQPDYYGSENPADTSVTGSILTVMKQLPQLQMPPTSTIAWFLAGYVFLLVPVNYFVLRAFDRREWAWFSVPLIAIAFSVASYLAARSIKGTDLLRRHVTIVQGGQGLARTDAMLWVRSPRRAYYDVSSPNASLALSDYQVYSADSRTNETRIRQDDVATSFKAEDVSVPMWTEMQFTGEGLLDVREGCAVQLKSGVPTLVNNSPHSLHAAFVVKNGRVWQCKKASLEPKSSAALKPLKAGSSAIDAIAKDAGVQALFTGVGGVAKADKTLTDLASAALRAAYGSGSRYLGDGAVIAWSRDAVSPLVLAGETPVEQNVSLFILRLAPTSALSGKATFESGAMTQINRVELQPKREEASPYEATFEGEVPDAKVLTISIKGSYVFNSGGYPSQHPADAANLEASSLNVAVYNVRTLKWEELGLKISSANEVKKTWRAQITGVASFKRQPDNIVRLRVRTKVSYLQIAAPILAEKK